MALHLHSCMYVVMYVLYIYTLFTGLPLRKPYLPVSKPKAL